MKKQISHITLSILLSFLFLVPGQAQNNTTDAPSIGETVEYINKILSSSLGRIKPVASVGTRSEITMQQFSLDSYDVESKHSYGEYFSCSIIYHTQIKNISWEALSHFEEEVSESLIELKIYLDYPLKWETEDIRKCNGRENHSRSSGNGKKLYVYVLPDKIENVKKALLHLKKLMYKEDPFGD